MVPGMTERERLITDMQRLEWLCDAVIGQAVLGTAPGRWITKIGRLSLSSNCGCSGTSPCAAAGSLRA